MKSQTIFPWNTESLPPISVVGGKGYSLCRMTSLGLKVPPGIILSVAFFNPWFTRIKSTSLWEKFLLENANGDEVKAKLDKIKEWSIENLSLEEAQKDQIVNALKPQNPGYINSVYAVRSSSPEEDWEGASFAGGYETYLGIRFNDLEKHILKAFISCMDYRVFKYKLEKGFQTNNMKIAIVIMQQINSDVSGVGFSINPMNNDYDEVVITSNFGLGESVVGGIINPDEYIINKVTKKVISNKLGKKEKIITLNEDGAKQGTSLKDSDHATSEKSSLNEQQLLDWVDKISFIEQNYNCPIDIEFAFEKGVLYLLQARAITTYNKLPEQWLTNPNERRKAYLDITLVVQGFDKPMSTMGSSILKLLFTYVFAKIFNTTGEVNLNTGIVDCFGGKLLLNWSGLWTKISKEAFGNFFKIISTAGANIVSTQLGEDYISETIPDDWNFYKIGMLWRLPVKRFLFPYWYCDSTKDWFLNTFKVINQEIQNNKTNFFNEKQSFKTVLHNNFDMITSAFRDCMLPTMYGGIICGYREWSNLFEPYIEKDENLRNDIIKLTQCLPNVTTMMGIELYKLSLLYDKQQYATINDFILAFNNHTLSEDFYKQFKDFNTNFGFRGEGELDIMNKRYYEDTNLLLTQIYNMSQGDDTTTNPIKLFEESEKNRPIYYNKLLAIAQEHGFRREFEKAYYMCINWYPNRESPKFYIIKTISTIREMILHITKIHFVEKNIFKDVNEIWDYDLNFIFESLKSQQKPLNREEAWEIRKRLNKEREMFLSWNRTPPIFDSRGRFFNQICTRELKENELSGEPVSWGVIKGKAKVMSHVDEKEFINGEILVTKATDPGWTPWIISSAAIVWEIGGMLQHGAWVSREFNKPCIVGVNNVMKIIHDGDEIEVDAVNGIIRILNKA